MHVQDFKYYYCCCKPHFEKEDNILVGGNLKFKSKCDSHDPSLYLFSTVKVAF